MLKRVKLRWLCLFLVCCILCQLVLMQEVTSAIITVEADDPSLIFSDDFIGNEPQSGTTAKAGEAVPVNSGGADVYFLTGPATVNNPAEFYYNSDGVLSLSSAASNTKTNIYNSVGLNKTYMEGKSSAFVTETEFKFGTENIAQAQKNINIYARFGAEYNSSYYFRMGVLGDLSLYDIRQGEPVDAAPVATCADTTALTGGKTYTAKMVLLDRPDGRVYAALHLYDKAFPDERIKFLEHTFPAEGKLVSDTSVYGPGFGITNSKSTREFYSFKIKDLLSVRIKGEPLPGFKGDIYEYKYPVRDIVAADITVVGNIPEAATPVVALDKVNEIATVSYAGLTYTIEVNEKPAWGKVLIDSLSMSVNGIDTTVIQEGDFEVTASISNSTRTDIEKPVAIMAVYNKDNRLVACGYEELTCVLPARSDGNNITLSSVMPDVDYSGALLKFFLWEDFNNLVPLALAEYTQEDEPVNPFDDRLRAAAGVYNWGLNLESNSISKTNYPVLQGYSIVIRWSNLEPSSGSYEFEKRIGKYLMAAAAEGIYVTLKIWVGPDAPNWIYAPPYNVPLVQTEDKLNPLGGAANTRYPYYVSDKYKEVFYRLIDELGSYFYSLPPETRDRLLFIQSAEGSTGDGQCYKSAPLDEQYYISDEVWGNFRKDVWARYKKNFPDVPILVNGDANSYEQNQWIIDNLDVFAVKQGMFSHGYVVSESNFRLDKWKGWYMDAAQEGVPFISRGEMDGELFTYGWSNRNIPQSLYWSGIFALHNMLDIWNIPHQALIEYPNAYAYTFFNRYAGFHSAAKAQGAFCALHEGLNAADFEMFPASVFGGVPGDRTNQARYIAIAHAFKGYGAKMEDASAAAGGGMANRKAKGVNDAGWDIISTNYYRYLEQIAPGTGDVGVWNVDETIYGRFGRSFESGKGKTFMKFKLDDEFFRDNKKPQNVKMSVTWLDRGTGSWSLEYARLSGTVEALYITNTDSGEWRTAEVTLIGAVFNGELDGADLILRHKIGEDTIFHMLELTRI
ncbi:MAG: hypothetical protein M0R40_01650 [Firmicutes bacterium]|nr:hypothetical protein [Bacillota bacterium]